MARQVLYAICHFNGSLARSITVGVILFSLQFVLLRIVIVLKSIFGADWCPVLASLALASIQL